MQVHRRLWDPAGDPSDEPLALGDWLGSERQSELRRSAGEARKDAGALGQSARTLQQSQGKVDREDLGRVVGLCDLQGEEGAMVVSPRTSQLDCRRRAEERTWMADDRAAWERLVNWNSLMRCVSVFSCVGRWVFGLERRGLTGRASFMACGRDGEERVTQLAQTRLAKSSKSESTDVRQLFSFLAVRGREAKAGLLRSSLHRFRR